MRMKTYKGFDAREQRGDAVEAFVAEHLFVRDLPPDRVVPQAKELDVRVVRRVALGR